MPRYGPPDGDAELRAYAALMSLSFATDPQGSFDWVRSLGAENVRVLRGDGVEAGLLFYRFGQYFGGRSVPAWGIAGVVVQPHLRGSGLGSELMTALLREMREAGVALSPLYPATHALYRPLGWETAGSRVLYRINPALLRPAKSALAPLENPDAARGRYAAIACARNGNLDRDEQIWKRVMRATPEAPLVGYVAGDDGYVLYGQKRPEFGLKFEITVRDLAFTERESGAAIVSHFARHASVVSQITLPGAPNDPLLSLMLPDQAVPVFERLDWMLRVVDVKAAIGGRGFPPLAQGRCVLRLRDEAVPGNDAVWSFEFEGGRATASQGGRDGAELDIGGFAALYSGLRRTRELRALGLLRGTESHDALLDAAFAGAPPWMPDFF